MSLDQRTKIWDWRPLPAFDPKQIGPGEVGCPHCGKGFMWGNRIPQRPEDGQDALSVLCTGYCPHCKNRVRQSPV